VSHVAVLKNDVVGGNDARRLYSAPNGTSIYIYVVTSLFDDVVVDHGRSFRDDGRHSRRANCPDIGLKEIS